MSVDELDIDTATVDWLLGRQTMKWRRYAPEVIPLWVADMDYPVARSVHEAVESTTAVGDFGYAYRDGAQPATALTRAFSDRMYETFGWRPDPSDCIAVTDLVQAMFATTLAFTDPGQRIVLQTPSYPPFREAIVSTGRRLAANPLVDTGRSYEIDFDQLPLLAGGDTGMMFLCNPQNPTGRVFTRAELERIAEIACRYDLVVVADEIHSDFIYDSARHIPFATISPEVARRTVTLASATKSFAIAGLKCGVVHFGSPELKEEFDGRIPSRLLGSVNAAGIDATIAAWRNGQTWLGKVTKYLEANRDFVAATMARELPEARLYRPEATYLAWIDFSALRLPDKPHAFFLDQARVAMSEGASFDPDYAEFTRLNFATTRPILSEALDRMINSIRMHGAR